MFRHTGLVLTASLPLNPVIHGSQECRLHAGCEALVGRANENLAESLALGCSADFSIALAELERTKASFCAAQIRMAYLYEQAVVRNHENRVVFIDESERGTASAVAINRRQTPAAS